MKAPRLPMLIYECVEYWKCQGFIAYASSAYSKQFEHLNIIDIHVHLYTIYMHTYISFDKPAQLLWPKKFCEGLRPAMPNLRPIGRVWPKGSCWSAKCTLTAEKSRDTLCWIVNKIKKFPLYENWRQYSVYSEIPDTALYVRKSNYFLDWNRSRYPNALPVFGVVFLCSMPTQLQN